MIAPAHIRRVLATLHRRGIPATPATNDAARWDARCPGCAGPLIVRDAIWQDRGRRVTLFCREHDETVILRELGLAERDLFLADLSSARRAVAAQCEAIVDKLEERYGSGLRNEEGASTRFPCPVCGAGEFDWQLYRSGEIAFPWLPLVVPDGRPPHCDNCARLEKVGRAA